MDAVVPDGQQPNAVALAGTGITDDAATLNSSFLEFLTDELDFGSEALDPATLEAVCQVANTQKQAGATAIKPEAFPAAQPGAAGTIMPTLKRPHEDPQLSDSDDDDDGGKGEKWSGKRTKVGEMSAAATKKACREKARREKLNERFLDLARLVDPGSEPKTDKSTILTDAIKYVQQITVENHQLRQLNKFLEERVSTLERERGQQLYQQSLMMTAAMGQGQMLQPGQPMMVGPPPGMMGAPMGHPQLAMPAAAMASAGNPMLAGASLARAPTPPLPMQPSQQQASSGGLMGPHGPAPGLLSQASGGMMAQAPGPMMAQMVVSAGSQTSMASIGAAAAAAGVTFNVGGGVGPGHSAGPGPSKPVLVNAMSGAMPYPMYWLPPQMMDSTQDSLLRPPAA